MQYSAYSHSRREYSRIATRYHIVTQFKVRCVWVEEDFLQQVIIFVEHALGYLHVALEGGARSILVLHHCRKGKGAHERNTQRVSHRLVVLIKCILMQTQPQLLVEVLEEYLAHVVTLLDDDCILL